MIQRYAKTAGILLLLTIFAGFFGELYVPSKLLAHDAATTAANIASHEELFRIGFAAYLVEACCDIGLALLFYVLLEPVSKYLALLSAFFGLVSTATFALTQFMYFVALPIQRSLQSFTPEQVVSIVQMSVKFYGLGSGVFMVFYGMATLLRGYLMYRSTYFPRFLGGLLVPTCGTPNTRSDRPIYEPVVTGSTPYDQLCRRVVHATLRMNAITYAHIWLLPDGRRRPPE